jgi:hypothetical protein
MNVSPTEIGGIAIFILQIILLLINLKVRADVAEVKLEMYKHFVTKADFRNYLKTGVIAHE